MYFDNPGTVLTRAARDEHYDSDDLTLNLWLMKNDLLMDRTGLDVILI